MTRFEIVVTNQATKGSTTYKPYNSEEEAREFLERMDYVNLGGGLWTVTRDGVMLEAGIRPTTI
jgi:hypothetical protein